MLKSIEMVARYVYSHCDELCWNAFLSKRRAGMITEDAWKDFYNHVHRLSMDIPGYLYDYSGDIICLNAYQLEPLELYTRISKFYNEREMNDIDV